MYSSTVPNSQVLLRQLVEQSGITSKEEELTLKQRFKRKFSHHINLMQYHRLREDRFIISQKKVLERQNQSIQKTKQYLQLRIEKANHIKHDSLTHKSKKMEADLTKWERIVQKNKKEEQHRIQQSETLIKNWNEKLSSSSSRKSTRLNELAKHLKQKSQEKQHRVSSFRKQEYEQLMKNPQEYQKNEEDRKMRYVEHMNNPDAKRSSRASRVSTESIYDKKKKQQQDLLEKSLLKTVGKQERINEARHVKVYLQQRRKKQQAQKQQIIKKMRENNLNSIKNLIQERNQILDQKFKNSRAKARKRSSLPQIKGSHAANLAVNGPGEQWRKKDIQINPYSACHSKNYDKLIVQKLKDVSMIMRRNRNN